MRIFCKMRILRQNVHYLHTDYAGDFSWQIEKIKLILTFYRLYGRIIMVFYLAKFLKRVNSMAMNYNKLWKLMIDRNLMKKDLIQMAGISTNAMAKMGKGGDVSTQVLRKICVALNCKIEDIVEITENESVF